MPMRAHSDADAVVKPEIELAFDGMVVATQFRGLIHPQVRDVDERNSDNSLNSLTQEQSSAILIGMQTRDEWGIRAVPLRSQH